MLQSEMKKTSGSRALIRDKILKGIYAPNSYLPSVRDLAEEFHLSKSTVHNSLKYLQEEQLIRLVPQKGALVLNSGPGRKVMNRIFIRPSDYGNFSYLPIITNILSGITRGCELRNTELNLSLADSGTLTDKIIAGYENGDWQGVIYGQCINYEELIAPLERAHVPYVIACDENNHAEAVRIYLDFHSCITAAVKHLHASGRRKIGLFSGELRNSFYAQIHQGYRSGLEACGLEYQPDLCLQGKFNLTNNLLSLPSRKKLLRLLQSAGRPDAVICIRQHRLLGLLDICSELNISIPEDLAVFSYDIPEDIRILHPEIPYIQEPHRKMGETAVALLQKWITTGVRPESVCLNPVIKLGVSSNS